MKTSATDLALQQVVDAVFRSIPLGNFKLPDEFFPAHLPVALIDAVFNSRRRRGDDPAPNAERYCSRFGISRTRDNHWQLPPVTGQESLADLIGHYDEIGVDGMANTVFRIPDFPETTTTETESVLHAAQALKSAGVCVLQDVLIRRPKEIAGALRSLFRDDDCTVRLLLMYTGRDNFVLGDIHVREFVADAIQRKAVSSARAVALVRRAAYELVLSPRFLDREIREFGARTRHREP